MVPFATIGDGVPIPLHLASRFGIVRGIKKVKLLFRCGKASKTTLGRGIEQTHYGQVRLNQQNSFQRGRHPLDIAVCDLLAGEFEIERYISGSFGTPLNQTLGSSQGSD